MDDAQCDTLGVLLERTLGLPVADRARFIEEACGANTALREELTALAAAFESSSDYFESLAAVATRALVTATGSGDGSIAAVGDTVSHYEIEERIGGGMGIVYRARDTRLGRPVALKFLPPQLAADESARERLFAEARAASALDHPNIGIVHEIGEAEPHGLFIALAWYQGETLKDRLTRGPLPVPDVIALARQIGAALTAAHAAGIIHRDIKPSNIVCTDNGVARLVDFGIAKTAGTDLTREGATPGTVAYMSPEQTRGAAVDPRSDLWSLGVVIYEMLAGRRPFAGDTDGTVIYGIRNDEPAPIGELRPDAPAGLARIVETCLAKTPSERYANAGALLADLQALDEDGSTPPGGGQTRYARRPEGHRRRRAAAIVLAAAVLALLGYLVRPGGDATSIAAATDLADDRRPAVAVLPFENRSGLEEDRYFTDGLNDEIRSRLARVASLRVTSRTSVMPYAGRPRNVRAVGSELGVNAVLEGAVLRAGNRVRVLVELVDARTDASLWSDSYDREIDVAGLVTIQREIAYSVAEALHAELTATDRARVAHNPTTSLEAYRHYMLGRHHWNLRSQEGMDSAFIHFQEALRLDPVFAAAHAAIADVHGLGYGPAGADGLALAIPAARAALRIDPDLAEAHASLGNALMYYQWDWPGAERAFRRAIELDPGYATAHQWYGEFLAIQGRMDEALAAIRVAEWLDPASEIIGWNVAHVLNHARRYVESVEQLRGLARVHPRSERVHAGLAAALMMTGRSAEAGELLDLFIERLPPDAAADRARIQALSHAVRNGRVNDMVEFFQAGSGGEPRRRMFTAAGFAFAGDADTAMRMLEEAYQQRSFGIMVADLAVGPLFDPLRDDVRFQNLLRRMGLDPGLGIRLRDQDPFWLSRS
jgi:eukaryotic-like serine/threonine-protein kinase